MLTLNILVVPSCVKHYSEEHVYLSKHKKKNRSPLSSESQLSISKSAVIANTPAATLSSPNVFLFLVVILIDLVLLVRHFHL